MVDLDLDVVVTREGHLYVDDEDEFAEHQVALGYPPEVIDLARRACHRGLSARIEVGAEPWRSAGLARLEAPCGAGGARGR